jgi:hypothetical protein
MSPNPIDNPAFFKSILVGGRAFPGQIMDVEGLELAIDWKNVKVPELLGWTTRWMGRVLCENIVVTCCFNASTPAQVKRNYADHYAFVKHLLGGTNPSAKPPGHAVTSTLFKAVFVKQIVVRKIDTPKFVVNKPVLVKYTFQDYAKGVPIAPAPPEPAKLDATTPEPKSIAEKAFVDAIGRLTAAQSADAVAAKDVQARYPGVGQ